MNVKGELCRNTVVIYRCGGCVFDAAFLNSFLDIIILTFMFFVVVKTLNFSLFNITKSEMDFCFLFFDDVEAVTFLDDAVFLLVLLLVLIVSAFGFDFWVSS